MLAGMSTTPGIYLDYNASTPIDPAVAAVMRPLLGSSIEETTGAIPSKRSEAGDFRRIARM